MNRTAIIVSGKSATHMPGGLGAYAMNIATILREMGYKVVVVGLGKEDEIFERDGVSFIHVSTPYNWLTGLGVAMVSPYFIRALEKHLDEAMLDRAIVVGMATWNYVGIKLKKRHPEKGIRTICSCFTTHSHELWGHVIGAPVSDYGWLANFKFRLAYWIDLLFIRFSDRIALEGADRIIIHYESTKKIIMEDYNNIEADKIIKMPYCIELYERQSGQSHTTSLADKQKPWVVVICRQDPRKGINSFIKAIAILESKFDFECFVIGSGPFLEENIKLSQRLGVDRTIQFLGFVNDIEPYLKGADVYVLPSVEEGSGAISLLEAMKLGVPIVTTYCDGIPEDFVHEGNALLVEMNDPHGLAKQIGRLLSDSELKDKISQQAIKDYEENFQLQSMTQALQEIITTLDKERGLS